MDTLSFQRLEALFETATALDAHGRESLLQGLREESAQIASRLEAMLRRSGPECDDAIQRATEAVRKDVPESPPHQIGRYRLLWTLGEGGFGIVYLAEQPAPAHRLLALKVIKPGMDTKAVLARFDDERQAMAKMDHPAVVTAIDAGTTDEGRPFVVMPLVPGPPITAYCVEQNLSLAERVALMAQVARGVQHTHARGVMHRDLKPGNILVAFADGTAQPRIIDFGLAKALGRPLTVHATLTQEGRPVGTPEYMSPEQARGGIADARSDVYSLGAILYELLTGKPPIEPATIRAKGESAIGDVISDAHVPPPSARTAERVPRELDWIALRCLEKEPDRRYPTAEALAADLERFVGGQRVAAGPPARMYRLWRWVKVRRGLSVSLGVAAIALLAGAGAAAYSGHQVRLANRSSTAALAILDGAFSGLDPAVAQRRDPALLIDMLRAQESAVRGFHGTDEVAAQLAATFAKSYWMIGEYASALPHAKRSRELAVGLWGRDDPRSVEALRLHLLVARESVPAGHAVFVEEARELEAEATRQYANSPRERIEALIVAYRFDIASVAGCRTKFAELQLECETLLGPSDRLTLRVMRTRAIDNEPAREMLALLREARRRAVEAYGPDDPDVDAGLATEGRLTFEVEHLEAARSFLLARLPHAERSLGEMSLPVLASTYNLGVMTLGSDPAGAEPYIRRAVTLANKRHGPESVWASWSDGVLLLFCLRMNQQDEAIEVHTRFIDRWQRMQTAAFASNVPLDEDVLRDLVLELSDAGDHASVALLVELARQSKPQLAETIVALLAHRTEHTNPSEQPEHSSPR